MKAVAFQKSLPINDPQSLQDVELPPPAPSPRDVLVEVKAISVNPVDYKRRLHAQPAEGQWAVLGWDAAGVVKQVGKDVTLFKPGDEVYYAGDIRRQGSNAELQVVDERVVGRKPASLSFAQAAALPLTTITAWELLFNRLGVAPGKQPTNETLLIVGAAGGVGSILTQLARRLTSMTVIGTASRPETEAWVRELGAHHVIDHSKPFADGLKILGAPAVTHVASLNQTPAHFAQIADILAPQGKLGLIDGPVPPLEVSLLMEKSISLHWELMYTRSLFETPDMVAQHELLTEVASLIDSGVIKTTLGEHFGRVSAENLKRAHALLESGRARGKIVLEGF